MNSRSKRILVVDDEPTVCEILHTIVEALGDGVVSTASPEAALGVIEKDSVDAVLTD